jgi:hypothetical protein
MKVPAILKCYLLYNANGSEMSFNQLLDYHLTCCLTTIASILGTGNNQHIDWSDFGSFHIDI